MTTHNLSVDKSGKPNISQNLRGLGLPDIFSQFLRASWSSHPLHWCCHCDTINEMHDMLPRKSTTAVAELKKRWDPFSILFAYFWLTVIYIGELAVGQLCGIRSTFYQDIVRDWKKKFPWELWLPLWRHHTIAPPNIRSLLPFPSLKVADENLILRIWLTDVVSTHRILNGSIRGRSCEE